jgi:predicted RNase H-like HicB family nuclease
MIRTMDSRTIIRKLRGAGRRLLTTYIALLRKDPDSDFGGDLPDFPGCITAGSTLEETRAMAQEAIEAHIECMRELGQMIPQPSLLDDVMTAPENAEAIPFPVAVSDHRGEGVEINLTIPEADLKKVDALAKKQGKSRSAVLTEAARRMIAASKDHAA